MEDLATSHITGAGHGAGPFWARGGLASVLVPQTAAARRMRPRRPQLYLFTAVSATECECLQAVATTQDTELPSKAFRVVVDLRASCRNSYGDGDRVHKCAGNIHVDAVGELD